jgi:hypothetical protein
MTQTYFHKHITMVRQRLCEPISRVDRITLKSECVDDYISNHNSTPYPDQPRLRNLRQCQRRHIDTIVREAGGYLVVLMIASSIMSVIKLRSTPVLCSCRFWGPGPPLV